MTTDGAQQHSPDRTEVEVTRDDGSSRYEGRVGDELVGVLEFRVEGRTVVVTHTGTEPRWRGHGVAGRLTRRALDDIRAAGQRVRPVCPYTADYLQRHPEDRDLIA